MWRKHKSGPALGKSAFGAMIALLLLSGCGVLPKEEQALKPPLVKPVKENFELYEVKRGHITKQVTGMATFASDRLEYLSFTESGGRLASVNVSLGSVVRAGDVVAELDKGDMLNRLRQQEINLEKARIVLEQTKNERPGDALSIRLKTLDVEKEDLSLQSLRQQLERTKLVSKTSGIVTYIEPLKQGDVVSAYKQLVTIADPKAMKLVYEFSNTNELTGIQIGMEAAVKYNSKEWKGKIVQIPATAPMTDNKSISEKNAKSVVISVEGLPEEAEIGQSADITIVTEQRSDVLIIPRVGLRSYMGRDYVQVLDGASRKEIDVEKGIVSSTEVEIRKGLQEGQKVILNN